MILNYNKDEPIVCTILEMSKALGVEKQSLRALMRQRSLNIVIITNPGEFAKFLWPPIKKIKEQCVVISCKKCNLKLIANLMSSSKVVKCFNCQTQTRVIKDLSMFVWTNKNEKPCSLEPDRWYFSKEISSILNIAPPTLTGGLGRYSLSKIWDKEKKRYKYNGASILRWLTLEVKIKTCRKCRYQWISPINSVRGQKSCPKCSEKTDEISINTKTYCSECNSQDLEDLCLDADGGKNIWLCKECGNLWPQQLRSKKDKYYKYFFEGKDPISKMLYEEIIKYYRKTYCRKKAIEKIL